MTPSPSTYTALNGDFYHFLETTATQRQKVTLQFFNEFRELHAASGLIHSLVTEGGEEFLEMVTGERIRLDRIIQLNGRFFPGYEGYEEALGARCSL
ncbi:MAG: hypothetical protein H7Y12_13325 [Sphingobacteriaceae bacterium]|nr:hypothetical protein [Cytophagaceae bacterium]